MSNSLIKPGVLTEEQFRNKFVKRVDGREFVTYDGLRYLAGQRGLKRLQVTAVLQIPSKDNGNLAVCMAEAEGADGIIYADVGDASPENCTARTRVHLVRMAATRAKARALRDFTGYAGAAFEELEDDDGPSQPSVQRPAAAPAGNVVPISSVAQPGSAADAPEANAAAYAGACEVCSKPVNAAIMKYSQRRFNKVLCMDCQKKEQAAE